ANHPEFFSETKMVEALKKLLLPSDDLVTVQAKMSAAAIGQRDHSFSEITRTLIIQYAQGKSSGWDALARLRLADFYWSGAKSIYGYQSEDPTIAGFVLRMFQQALEGFDVISSTAARNLAIDFRSFRDSKRSAPAVKTLARKTEGDLEYATEVTELPWETIKDA